MPDRPLSPHLQVYRPQMTSVLSILHRACGAALAVGTLLVVAWLMALATGAEAFAAMQGLLTSPIGQLMLIGWSGALYYHLCNGIRHLVWDTGRMMTIKGATYAGYIVLVSATILTALTWCLVMKG